MPPPAEEPHLPVEDLTVEGSSRPPATDLIQSMDRVIDNMAECIAICESTIEGAPRNRFPFGLKSVAAKVQEATRKDLDAASFCDQVDDQSVEDEPRFVSAILTPLEPDDHEASLLPILKEDGEVGEWSTDSACSIERPQRFVDHARSEETMAITNSSSGMTLDLEKSTYIAESYGSEYYDGYQSPAFIYAAAVAISEDENTVAGETAEAGGTL